jgi:hypothetical protein
MSCFGTFGPLPPVRIREHNGLYVTSYRYIHYISASSSRRRDRAGTEGGASDTFGTHAGGLAAIF